MITRATRTRHEPPVSETGGSAAEPITESPAGPGGAPVRARSRLGGLGGRVAVLVAGVLLLAGVAATSLLVGAGGLSPEQVWASLQHRDGSQTSVIVWDMRVTRTLTAALAGLALGVAGILMQAITRNPLADPGLLGVNAGAGLAVVIAVGVFGLGGFTSYVWFALAGACIVSILVYLLGFTAARDAPATLVLAGTAISAVLIGVTTGLALIDPSRFNALRAWMAGSVTGRDFPAIGSAAILVAAGLLVAIVFTRQIGQLALGEDVARSLGVHVTAARIGGAIAVMILAGTATAIAGPIVFIGLMVPHLAHALIGQHQGWALSYGCLAGALLLIGADILGRVAVPGVEAPAGIVTAILGAPVLALLARGRTETT